MRARGVPIAVGVTALCVAGAIFCHVRSLTHRREAAWLLARGEAQGREYSASLNSSFAEEQLATFEARRVVLERAHDWHRVQLVFILATVVGAFSTYLVYLLGRLQTEVAEAYGAGRAKNDTVAHAKP